MSRYSGPQGRKAARKVREQKREEAKSRNAVYRAREQVENTPAETVDNS